MTVLDINVLLYGYDPTAPEHGAATSWLENLFHSPEIIGLPWHTILGFLRISTNKQIRPRLGAASDAFEKVRDWLAQPGVVIVQPGPRHLEILERLVIDYQAPGPKLSDAVLAALAIENGATLASTDRDFSRFPNLRWVNPLA